MCEAYPVPMLPRFRLPMEKLHESICLSTWMLLFLAYFLANKPHFILQVPEWSLWHRLKYKRDLLHKRGKKWKWMLKGGTNCRNAEIVYLCALIHYFTFWFIVILVFRNAKIKEAIPRTTARKDSECVVYVSRIGGAKIWIQICKKYR